MSTSPRKRCTARMPKTVALTLALACVVSQPAFSDEIVVFAAASLTDAIEEVSEAFEQHSGHTVIPVFASSAILARQIAEYAPADIFVSASTAWMDYLAQQSLIVPGSRQDLLANGLVLIAPNDRPVPEDALARLVDVLGDDGRLAIGDPDSVPAGIYAAEALSSLGLWDQVAPRTARAGNVRAALAMVARGEAPFGIVYATDALISDDVVIAATVPPDSHTPIVYPVGLVADIDGADATAAQAYLEFLSSETAVDLFRFYGFEPLTDGG